MDEIVKRVKQRAPDVAKEGVAGLKDTQGREVRLQVTAQTAEKMQALLNPVQVTTRVTLNDRDLPVEGLTTAAAKA